MDDTDALEIVIDEIYTNAEYEVADEAKKAVEYLREQLKPKCPDMMPDNYGGRYSVCPACGFKVFRPYDESLCYIKHGYCTRCGQKIDWD